MTKLCFVSENSAKPPLVAVLRQATRWSSTFAMLKRYFQLREFILADDEELADYLASRASHRKLEALLSSLCDVESVSKRLQDKDLTLLDPRILFDALLHVRPTFVNYLGTQLLCSFLWGIMLKPVFYSVFSS
jgi:hypothetical protein